MNGDTTQVLKREAKQNRNKTHDSIVFVYMDFIFGSLLLFLLFSFAWNFYWKKRKRREKQTCNKITAISNSKYWMWRCFKILRCQMNNINSLPWKIIFYNGIWILKWTEKTITIKLFVAAPRLCGSHFSNYYHFIYCV